jgi:hypothetical protein
LPWHTARKTVLIPTGLPRSQESHPSSGEHFLTEAEFERLLVEYDELDGEFNRLDELWLAAKRVVMSRRPHDVVPMLDIEQVQQELAALHSRQHEILNRQAEIEGEMVRSHRRQF